LSTAKGGSGGCTSKASPSMAVGASRARGWAEAVAEKSVSIRSFRIPCTVERAEGQKRQFRCQIHVYRLENKGNTPNGKEIK
jgi:hypothetical protein